MEELRKEIAELRRLHEELIEVRLEDQRRIDQVERQVTVINTAFNDLKSVEKEYESQFLLQESHHLHIEEDDDNGTYCMKHFCCFFCM